MKKLLILIVLVGFVAAPLAAQVRKPRPGPAGAGGPGPVGRHAAVAPGAVGEWTGYVTDSHCGMKGANAKHTADCVQMCIKGGAKVQLVNEADQKFYTLDSFYKLEGLVGIRVTVKGTLGSDGRSIAVESAEKAKAPELP